MDLFANLGNSFQLLTTLEKKLISFFLQGSEYASGTCISLRMQNARLYFLKDLKTLFILF